MLSLASPLLFFLMAQPRTPKEVRTTLAREVKFDGVEDPKATIQEVLMLIGKRHNLTIQVNEAAFKADGLMDVQNVPLIKPIKGQKAIQLDRVLRQVLERIPTPSQTVFVIRGNVIQVTTGLALRQQNLRPEPPPPTASMTRRTQELKVILLKPVKFDGLDNPTITLASYSSFRLENAMASTSKGEHCAKAISLSCSSRRQRQVTPNCWPSSFITSVRPSE